MLVLALAPAAQARQPMAKGTWARLPPAPSAAALVGSRAAVWTGKQLIVFGRIGTPGAMRNAAFSYAPATGRWRTLSPPRGDSGSYEGSTSAVWTGKRMLVWGPLTALSYDPATNVWRRIPTARFLAGAPSPLVVWTGREMITWGGGCCGEASRTGGAYDPATGKWRQLAEAPIAAQQGPTGVWTGRELIILPGRDIGDRPTGGAAYDPAKDTWRKIASPPRERLGPTAVWDGRELLVVGGVGPPDPKTGNRKLASIPLAYDPATNRWRSLSPMDNGAYGRAFSAVVWSGKALLLWGGETQAQGRYTLTTHGLAYDPRANRWSQLPTAPLLPRLNPVAAWTGKALLVWGGDPLLEGIVGSLGAPDSWPFMDGATYTPSA